MRGQYRRMIYSKSCEFIDHYVQFIPVWNKFSCKQAFIKRPEEIANIVQQIQFLMTLCLMNAIENYFMYER